MTKEQLRLYIARKNPAKWYPVFVSEYIHERYSQDDETALINNYLSDPEGHAEEYQAYQAFRAECKERAKRDLGMNEEESNG